MSLLTLASVAVARDLTAPGQRLAKDATVSKMQVAALGTGAGQPTSGGQATGQPAEPAAGQPDGGGPAPAGSGASFAQLLVAQIPSEALLAYTTLLALFTVGGVSYNIGRWGLYAAAIVACAVAVLGSYFAQRDHGFDDTQTATALGAVLTPSAADAPAPAHISALGKLHLPYLPVLTAVLAMAVYGLTVPGSPLQFEVSGPAFAICSGCLAVGGGVMMSAFAPFLGMGNGARAVAKQPGTAPPPRSPMGGEAVAAGTSAPPAPARAVATITPAPDTQDIGPLRPSSS